MADPLGPLGRRRAPSTEPDAATNLALLCFLAVPGSKGSSPDLRPNRAWFGKLRTQRKALSPGDAYQNQDHRERQKGPEPSSPRHLKLLACGFEVARRRVEVVAAVSTLGQRLLSCSSHSRSGSLGKIQVQVLRSHDTLANTRDSADHQHGTPLVRQRAWQALEGTQPSSVSSQVAQTVCTTRRIGKTPVAAGPQEGYMRTTRRRIENMQSEVARLLWEGGGAHFGEN